MAHTADDTSAVIAAYRDEVARLHRYMCRLGATRTFALFVTDDGLRWIDVERSTYTRLVEQWAHQIVGYYNARADREYMLADALSEAQRVGVL